MRILISCSLIIFFYCSIQAEDFSVFEKDGRYGIKTEAGEVAIPAVYEKLGWSNGSQDVFEGVIGYRRDDRWGLVSIKNKVLTENKFYTLTPFEGDLFLASIKGRFSNHLFHGIVDLDGEVKISFNYFALEPLENYFKATEFDQYRSKVGLLNEENKVIIPIKYKEILKEKNWFVAERFDQKKDVFLDGQLVTQGIDSVRHDIGLICFKNGLAGYFNERSIQELGFDYKGVNVVNGKPEAIDFPLWQVYDGDSKLLEKNCDSLSMDDGLWTMHLNGVRHKVFSTDKFKVSTDHEIQEVAGENLIVRNIKTSRWSVLDSSGKETVQDQDSIFSIGDHFIVKVDRKWNLYNGFGTKVNRFPFQSLKRGVDNHFIAKKNNYWGVIDFTGKNYINFKYDLIELAGESYIARFHSKWGILDKHGNWKFYPEFEEFEIYGELVVGRKGAAYSYFSKQKLVHKSTFVIDSRLGNFFSIKDEDGKLGVLNDQGRIVAEPAFVSAKRIGTYFVLRDSSFSTLIDSEGKVLVGKEQGYEDFGDLSEEYISAKRNGRWGFVDSQGRLRISNRYEGTQPFNEEFAAVKLRGRWGFIDKGENLKVQPHYENVSSFRSGLAIVKENERFGLINKEGQEVLAVIYPWIERSINGNYLITNDQEKIGLADENGSFVLTPNYTHLVDLKQAVLIKENGKMGVLDYQGNQKFSTSYSDIKVQKGFLLLRK